MTTAPRPLLTGVPVLETARLILRAPETRDFEPFATYSASARARFTGGPLDRASAWRSFCHLTGHWIHRGYGLFVIEARDDGRALGSAGPFFPEGWPEPEIGWTLWSPRDEGRGYAFEAAGAARAYAYDILGWQTAISLIDADNHRSQALARRLGCAPEGEGAVMGSACTIWRHPAAETQADGGLEAYA
ncbi:MAG: acetyltransferase [Rhodobacteraceae bacterium HLUCCA12]|nr:MAG: acetyltransferase [Rhodobacteraceae bacterium HLUCCA12]